MEKRHSVKAQEKASSLATHDEICRELEASELQAVAGRGRLRVPIGYTDTGDPIYGDESSSADPIAGDGSLRLSER